MVTDSNFKVLSLDDVAFLAAEVANELEGLVSGGHLQAPIRLYGVPRGGITASLFVAYHLADLEEALLVSTPEEANVIVDDIIDSGSTMHRYREKHDARFVGLVDKVRNAEHKSWGWVLFPWEVTDGASSSEAQDADLEEIGRRLIQQIGSEDLSRNGLLETPARFAKAFRHLTSGYTMDVAALFKKFTHENAADEMIIIRQIPLYSLCEHHIAPFFGTAAIGYVPSKTILGLSKFSRLVDAYSRRLQTQENLTNQIAQAIQDHLDPRGVGVVTSCRHMCMESRGIHRAGITTEASALRGCFIEGAPRAEFLNLIRAV